MNILLLSAYDTPSHQRWRTGLVSQFPEHKWTTLSLAPRYFSWRIRGNPVSWSREPALQRNYDLLIATSMVDLATLRGLCPQLAVVPSLLYFHENQFAYPLSQHQQHTLEPQMVTLYGAMAATRLAFNSRYNRHTFLDGVDRLLTKMPDQVPAGIRGGLEAKSTVLPVPLEDALFATGTTAVRSQALPMRILWNHRWEYDKGPDRLLALIQALPSELRLQFDIAGQQFRQQPQSFETIQALLRARGWLGQWGFVPAVVYSQCLSKAHVVLSTAIHDFQGLSVLEAAAQGALPLVPNRLAYTELFPAECRYLSVFDNSDLATHGAPVDESRAAAAALVSRYEQLSSGSLPVAPDLHHLGWISLQNKYQQLMLSLAHGSGEG